MSANAISAITRTERIRVCIQEPPPEREPSFNVSFRFGLDTLRAGINPHSNPVKIETPAVKTSTFPSSSRLTAFAFRKGGRNDQIRFRPQYAMTTPLTPPRNES